MPPTEPGEQMGVRVPFQKSQCARLGKSVTGWRSQLLVTRVEGGRREVREQADWGTPVASVTAVLAHVPCVPTSGPAAHVPDWGSLMHPMPHDTGVTGTPCPNSPCVPQCYAADGMELLLAPQ